MAQQRLLVDGASDALFQISPDNTTDAAKAQALERYHTFLEWVRSTDNRELDHKSRLALDIRVRLQEVQIALVKLHARNQRIDLSKLLELCATSSKAGLDQAIANCRGCGQGEQNIADADSLMETVAEPLSTLRSKWALAVESRLAAAKSSRLEAMKRKQKRTHKSDLDKASRQIVQNQFDKLREGLLAKNALLLKLTASARKGLISCEGTREVLAPATAFNEIATLDMNAMGENFSGRVEVLGQHLLNPNEKHVAMFTIKVRSAVQVAVGKERMCIKLLQFPRVGENRRSPLAKETIIRTFGKRASVCDYDARSRVIAFLSEDSVGIYKFDESFKSMERVKAVELDTCSTLTALPFTDILLLDNALYVTDSSGFSQSIDTQSDQTSTVIEAFKQKSAETNTSRSRLMGFADNLAFGALSLKPTGDGSFVGDLSVISRDDYRQLPTLQLDKSLLSEGVSVQCTDDTVFVLDPLARQISIFSIRVSVRSGSFRVRKDEDKKTPGTEANGGLCLRKQHWLYTFYHVFEKFPVIGLLDDEAKTPVDILVTCLVDADAGGPTALEACHDFLSLVMSDLMALNKELSGLDLAKNLRVQHASLCEVTTVKPLDSFLQTLITFLPIQICRAEANTLTVLVDGVDQPPDSLDDAEFSTWESADIAESIRFGLLSPVLRAWEGRCVVITSMGKQSTGKSYFLNHLTGSSFAIAGNRCTDGAWMTLRIMQSVMFVILDFEGLGSFERTDQEDVFLAILNASLSMFTVFRTEMRMDKEVDGHFTMFQKGIGLLKDNEHLFQGMLYMSVKDINPDDGHGVISEFHRKIEKLLTANPNQNFVTEMYSGKVAVNCSPPFRSSGYHKSLLHARQVIEELMNDQKRPKTQGFKNGRSFHDTIRLVLAKISILDWTGVNEGSDKLQVNDLLRKLPGVIRTGCLIPLDYYAKDESPPQYLKQSVLCPERDSALLRLEELGRDHANLVKGWNSVNQQVALDGISDVSIDFGPSVCAEAGERVDGEAVHLTLVALFQRYLAKAEKGEFERIWESDYDNFDALLSFLVSRRKAKVALWVMEFLGADRFVDEWKKIEQTHLSPFEALFKRQHEWKKRTTHVHLAHTCGALCESEGICSKFVRVGTGRFKGKYDRFDFDLKRMVGVRNKCAITLQPGQTHHSQDEGHSCERQLPNGRKTIHWCEAKCVACEYYCEKPVGHDELHSAAHGNMGNTHFITKEEVVEWDDRKYAAGEKGIAEMCSLYCSKAGRGHVHYLQCDKDNAEDCPYKGELDQRRHCQTVLVKPRPEHEVDEVLHAKYWEEVGWEDPCPSAAERALFAKCPYLCIAREHKERGKAQSGCDLPAWHAPATSAPFVELNGFTYINGHRFSCSHASTVGVVHHVFVLDCSGSMRGEPWKHLLNGVREYLRGRIASGATQDMVSVVTFGDKGAIAFERAKIENAVTRAVKFHGGGTNYALGLRLASAIISRTHLNLYKPVLIFFTDGRPGDGKKGLELARTIRQRYAMTGLRSFVVGYGRVSDLGVADLADKLGGTVYEAMTGADVGEAFRSICLSLGARAGLICSTNA